MSLGSAHGEAVEGDVVVHSLGVADQAVVGNDLDPGGARFLSGRGGGGAVLRADDQDFNALRDQSFDVGLFLGGIALAEEDLNFVTGGGKSVLEAGLILDPARFVLRGKYDADGQGACRRFGCLRPTGRQDHHDRYQYSHQAVQHLFRHVILLLLFVRNVQLGKTFDLLVFRITSFRRDWDWSVYR